MPQQPNSCRKQLYLCKHCYVLYDYTLHITLALPFAEKQLCLLSHPAAPFSDSGRRWGVTCKGLPGLHSIISVSSTETGGSLVSNPLNHQTPGFSLPSLVRSSRSRVPTCCPCRWFGVGCLNSASIDSPLVLIGQYFYSWLVVQRRGLFAFRIQIYTCRDSRSNKHVGLDIVFASLITASDPSMFRAWLPQVLPLPIMIWDARRLGAVFSALSLGCIAMTSHDEALSLWFPSKAVS